jgi:hypothetical protein
LKLLRPTREGRYFPYLSTERAGDSATEFPSRCRLLGTNVVTLHSYHAAWVERIRVAGISESFAQEA